MATKRPKAPAPEESAGRDDGFDVLRDRLAELNQVKLGAVPDLIRTAAMSLRESIAHLLTTKTLIDRVMQLQKSPEVQVHNAQSLHQELLGDAYFKVGDVERAMKCYLEGQCMKRVEALSYQVLTDDQVSLAADGFSSLKEVPDDTCERLGGMFLERKEYGSALAWFMKASERNLQHISPCVDALMQDSKSPFNYEDWIVELVIEACKLIDNKAYISRIARYMSEKGEDAYYWKLEDVQRVFDLLSFANDTEGMKTLAGMCLHEAGYSKSANEHQKKEFYTLSMQAFATAQSEPTDEQSLEYAESVEDLDTIERIKGKEGLIEFGEEARYFSTRIRCYIQADATEKMKALVQEQEWDTEPLEKMNERTLEMPELLNALHMVGDTARLKKIGDFFSLKKDVDAVRAYVLAGEPKLAVAVVKQFEENGQLGRAAIGYTMLNEKKKAEQIIKTLIAEGATNDQLEGAKYALRYLEDERALQVADRLHLAQGEYRDAEYVYDDFGKKISSEMKLRCADVLFAKGETRLATKMYEAENASAPPDCWERAGDALCANFKDFQVEKAIAAYTAGGATEKLLALGKQLIDFAAHGTFPKLKVGFEKDQHYNAKGLQSFADVCFKNAAELLATQSPATEKA